MSHSLSTSTPLQSIVRASGLVLVWSLIACANACANAPTPASKDPVPHPTALPTPAPSIAVHGHRGARALFPENSLVAFDHALSVGVDVLELDLVVTRDDKLVVAHDPILSDHVVDLDGVPDTSAAREIRQLTLTEVKAFKAGTKVNPRFPKQKIGAAFSLATLDEVFTLVKTSAHAAAATVRFNIETKGVPGHPELTPDALTFATLVVETLRKHEMEERTIVQSFDVATLKEVRRLSTKVELSFLNADSRPDFVPMLKAMNVDILSPHHLWITKGDVEALHAHGIQVVPWTANTPKEWDHLIALGVDGIISDDPKALIAHLQAKGLRP